MQAATSLNPLHCTCVRNPYSRTAERAAEYAAQHGCDRTFTSLEELGACADVDAVYIASPTSEHAKQSIMLLGMGKHVLCEKPACSHATELAAVIAAAEASGKTFMEAMRPLKTPNFDAVKAKLAELGPARHFSGTFCQYSSRWPAYLASTASGGQGEVPNAFLPVSPLACFSPSCISSRRCATPDSRRRCTRCGCENRS